MIKDVFWYQEGIPAQKSDETNFTAMLHNPHASVVARYGMRNYCRIIVTYQFVQFVAVVESKEDIVYLLSTCMVDESNQPLKNTVTLVNEKTGTAITVHPPVLSIEFE